MLMASAPAARSSMLLITPVRWLVTAHLPSLSLPAGSLHSDASKKMDLAVCSPFSRMSKPVVHLSPSQSIHTFGSERKISLPVQSLTKRSLLPVSVQPQSWFIVSVSLGMGDTLQRSNCAVDYLLHLRV